MVKISSTTARAIARVVRLDCRRRSRGGGSGAAASCPARSAASEPRLRPCAPPSGHAACRAQARPRVARPDDDWPASAQALNLGKADAPA